MAPSYARVTVYKEIIERGSPKHIFDPLMLPHFCPPSFEDDDLFYEYDDPPQGNSGGEDSSHRTTTNPELGGTLNNIHAIPNNLKGAIIHCEGDRESPQVFEPISISSMEGAFHAQDEPCSVPSVIGLPIWMRPHNHDPHIDRANSAATWLRVVGDLDAKQFGFVTKRWEDSAVVMRVDGRTLLPQHLEALCWFCRFVFGEVVGNHQVGSYGLSEVAGVKEMQKRTFRKLVSPRGFLDFYEEYRLRKAVEDKRWCSLPSPYDHDLLEGKSVLHMSGHRQSISAKPTTNGDSTGEAAPRRSARTKRAPSWVLEDSGTANSPTDDDEPRGRPTASQVTSSATDDEEQPRGRTKKRRRSMDE